MVFLHMLVVLFHILSGPHYVFSYGVGNGALNSGVVISSTPNGSSRVGSSVGFEFANSKSGMSIFVCDRGVGACG